MVLNVVNASVAEPIIRSVPLSATRAETLLERCALSPVLLEKPKGLVPLHAAEAFLFHAQRISGDPCFSFQTVANAAAGGRADVANIPVRGAHVALDGLKDFVAAVNGVLTGTRFWLQLDKDAIWLLRNTGTTQWCDTWPLVLYNLAILLEGVRCVLGPDVRPSAIRVACASLSETLPEALRDIPLELGSPVTGLAFDRALLKRSGIVLPKQPAMDERVYRKLSAIDCSHITECLCSLLPMETGDRLADRAAAAFGMSRRTYQRQLRKLGTTHRALLEDARLSLAADLLADPAWSITQIAQELGYRHHGDFTRFFRHRTGLAPSELR